MPHTKATRILRAVESARWAIQEEKLEEIVGLLEMAANGERLDKEVVRARFGRQAAAVAERRAGPINPATATSVAVIPLHGTICHRAGMMAEWSGGTSCEAFAAAFDAALNHPDVRAIVIDIDSPGGTVEGVTELSARIFNGRGRKDIHAVVNPLCASAAYWIGSAADTVTITPSGRAGSIGCFTIHTDFSAALEKEGIRKTIIRYGPHKAEANPFTPLAPETEAELQSEMDEIGAMFENDVARNRGVPRSKVQKDFGGGRVLSARRALKAGMVDGIGTLEDVLAGYGVKPPAPAGRRAVSDGPRPTAAIAMEGGAMATAKSVRRKGAVPVELHPVRAAEAEECPECGAPMEEEDELYVCPECGHEMAMDDEDEDEPEADGAAKAKNTPRNRKAAAARTRSDTMPQDVNAAVAAALETERKRAADIRRLCADFKMDATFADEMVENGTTVEAAAQLIIQKMPKPAAVGTTATVGRDWANERPFQRLGDQLQSIIRAETKSEVDERLLKVQRAYAAASGTSTAVDSDAGWAIQADHSTTIVKPIWETGKVLSRINRVPISAGSNALVRMRLSETARTTGSRNGGVRVYRAKEASTVEGSKQKYERQRIELEKLMGIYYATEETLQDAVALTAEAETGFRSEMTFVMENEVFWGKGAGEGLGFMECPDLLITISKESGQAAATIVAANVLKMMSRFNGSLETAAFFISRGCIPQLATMTIGNQPVWIAGGSLESGALGTLLGVPVIPVEYCSQVGTKGDIVLADLKRWTGVDKGGETWESSIHVRFLHDETAFRITNRFNGQPDDRVAITPFKGTDTLSPFVVIETRS
jgi:HK97 family phage major capsid protein